MNFGFLVLTWDFKSERIQPNIFGSYTPFLGKPVKAATPPTPMEEFTNDSYKTHQVKSWIFISQDRTFFGGEGGEERGQILGRNQSLPRPIAALNKNRALLQSTGYETISRSPIFGVKSYFR